MSHEDQVVRDFRRRLTLLQFARHAVRHLTAAAFLFGTIVLVLRAGFGFERGPLVWAFATWPALLAPALVLALRARPTAATVRALLDGQGRCGGLVMAGGEVPLGDWKVTLPSLAAPRLQWRGRRTWRLAGVSALFLLVAFLLPQRYMEPGRPRLNITRETEKLSRQLDVLKEETILDPVRAETLQQKLEQIQREARGDQPARTLEALDHLEKVARQLAKSAAEASARTTNQMTRVEAAADALQKAGEQMKDEARTEAMKQLAELTRKAAEENDLLRKKMKQEELAEPGDDEATFNSDQLARLSRALKEGKKGAKERLDRLQREGLLRPEDLQYCKGEEEYDLDALAEYLARCEGQCSLEELLSKCDKPGRGGISRGPAPAELTFGKETSEEGAKFKEIVLPPATLQELRKSQLVKVSSADPKKSGNGGPAEAGALGTAAASGGSANTAVVLPRHRAAVQRYFDRPK